MCAAAYEEWRERIDEAVREREEKLDLDDCDMGKEAGRMQYLSEFLKNNKTVKELWLIDNQLGDEGVFFLSEGLRVNQTVELLSLASNRIGDRGMCFLSEGLKVNKSLKILDLDNNRIGNEGMRYLSEGLKVNETLKDLLINHNQIGYNGMEMLIKAIRMNTSLVKVVAVRNDCWRDAERNLDTALADVAARQAGREELLSQEACRIVKSAAKR